MENDELCYWLYSYILFIIIYSLLVLSTEGLMKIVICFCTWVGEMKDALSAVSRSFIIYMYIGVTIRKSCISKGFHITVAACVGRLLSLTFPEIGSGRCDLRVRNLLWLAASNASKILAWKLKDLRMSNPNSRLQYIHIYISLKHLQG